MAVRAAPTCLNQSRHRTWCRTSRSPSSSRTATRCHPDACRCGVAAGRGAERVRAAVEHGSRARRRPDQRAAGLPARAEPQVEADRRGLLDPCHRHRRPAARRRFTPLLPARARRSTTRRSRIRSSVPTTATSSCAASGSWRASRDRQRLAGAGRRRLEVNATSSSSDWISGARIPCPSGASS